MRRPRIFPMRYIGTLLCSVGIEALRLLSLGEDVSVIRAFSNRNKSPEGVCVPCWGVVREDILRAVGLTDTRFA